MVTVDGPFAQKPTLTGELVVLRPMAAGDAAAVYDVVTDPVGRRLTGTHRTFSRDEIAAWTASRGDLDDRLDLVIVDRATDVVVGEVVINDWDEDNLSCGFRIGIGPAAAIGASVPRRRDSSSTTSSRRRMRSGSSSRCTRSTNGRPTSTRRPVSVAKGLAGRRCDGTGRSTTPW